MQANLVEDLTLNSNLHGLDSRVERFLRALIEHPEVHGKYLNMLSYIEHLGSRYLMLTHNAETLNGPVLKHYLEEVRHSYTLRRMAEKTLGRSLTYQNSDLLAATSAKMYFARLATLGRKCARESKDSDVLSYLYVSGAVEIRALWLYSMHDRLLRQNKIGLTFASILEEEKEHVEHIFSNLTKLDPQAEGNLRNLVRKEGELFRILFLQLVNEVAETAA